MEQTVKQAHIKIMLSRLHDTKFTWHRGVHTMFEDAIRHFGGIIYTKKSKTMCQVISYA